MLHRASPRAESCPGIFSTFSAGSCDIAPMLYQWWGCRGDVDTVSVPVPTDEPAGASLQDAEAMGWVLK